MAQISLHTRNAHPPATGSRSGLAILAAVAIISLVVGLAPWDMTASQAVVQADPDLAKLMRFMAAIKGLMALGALALIGWRFGYDATPRTQLAYLLTGALLMAGTGFIWRIDTVVEGAVAFHLGLGLLIALACLDKGGHQAVSSIVAVRRAAIGRSR